MAANPHRAERTNEIDRDRFKRCLGDWQMRPLDAITRRDVEGPFNRITGDSGWSMANQSISLLRSIYRRSSVDFEDLRNPVDLWLAGGGRYHRPRRRKISAPAEVLPCWKKGIESTVGMMAARDALWYGLYTGMRLNEVLPLRWERADMAGLVFRVEETKTGEPLELPITRQLAAILERRWAAREALPGSLRDWVFPSSRPGTLGHVATLMPYYAPIGKAGGARFWFHALRNCFITVAERELMLPRSLTKRLVNHARSSDITEGYAAEWTVGQLREPAQRIADRIEALMNARGADTAEPALQLLAYPWGGRVRSIHICVSIYAGMATLVGNLASSSRSGDDEHHSRKDEIWVVADQEAVSLRDAWPVIAVGVKERGDGG